jgi:hypothetical protein
VSNSGVQIETVNDYQHKGDPNPNYATCCVNTGACGSFSFSNQSGTNFANQIVFGYNVLGLGITNQWLDKDVWDMDFYDPQLGGNSSDDDISFDMPGLAISFFQGH